jgi:hypothetical protein
MSQGRKNTLKPRQFITAGSMGADYVSEAFDISEFDNICIQLIWTGTSPVGDFQVQGTMIDSPATDDWVDLLDTAVAAGGAAGTALINLSDLALTDMRVTYTYSSGTGTLTGWHFAKSL